MTREHLKPSTLYRKDSFWLNCPFCQTSFTVDLFRLRSSGHLRRHAKDAPGSTLDPDDLFALLEEMPAAQIAALYGVSKKEVEQACRAFGLEPRTEDEPS